MFPVSAKVRLIALTGAPKIDAVTGPLSVVTAAGPNSSLKAGLA